MGENSKNACGAGGSAAMEEAAVRTKDRTREGQWDMKQHRSTSG